MTKKRKRGGSEFAPPEPGLDRGPLTCGGCNGVGKRVRPVLERDDDEHFDGEEDIECHACGGTGTVWP